MKVVVAAGGRFHAFHLANQLEKRGALKKFYTASYTKKDRHYINSNLIEKNRSFNFVSEFYLRFHFYKFLNKSKFHVFTDNLFDSWLNKKIRQENKFDIFVGWANYFLNSIENIKKTGAKTIVECGSSHILEQLDLLKEEYEKFGLHYKPICKKNLEKMLLEYEQADYIMTCSNFAKRSFIKHGISENKILKVPLGVNLDLFKKRNLLSNDKFRVIFVGLICLRKGLPYLLEAWKKLNLPENKAELILVGNVLNDMKPFLKNFRLSKNIIFYGTTNQKKLADLYSQSNLFISPSIEDGWAMTVTEAMAAGVPTIVTTNTGSSELINDNENGFIIPIRNSDILANKILWCYKNPEKCLKISLNAQQNIEHFSWNDYGNNILNEYKKII